jgi:DNA repair protein RadC
MQTDGIQLRELAVRYSVKKTDAGEPVVVGRALKSPCESAALLMRVLADQPTEVFAMLCLSTKHRVIAYHEVSRGTLDSTLVHPREVFKAALLANTAAVMCRSSLCGRARCKSQMTRVVVLIPAT